MSNNPFGQLFGQGQLNAPIGQYNQGNNSSNSYNNNSYEGQGYNYEYGSKPSSFKTIPTLTTGPKQLPQYDTSIGIQKLSPKQLLCQCIDLATAMFKQIIDVYVKNNSLSSPYQGKKVVDFSLLANFMLQPTRLQKLLTQFIPNDDQSVKALVKSWIFQMKYIRNLWAHSEKINYRLAFRGYDTLGLLFDSFNGDQSTELYQKIETYRKALLIVQAKNGF